MRSPKRDWQFDVQLCKIQAKLIGNLNPDDLVGRDINPECLDAIVQLLKFVGFDVFNLYRHKGSVLNHRSIDVRGNTVLKIYPDYKADNCQYQNLNILLTEDGEITTNGFRISKIPVPGVGDDGVLHIVTLSDSDCFYLGIDDTSDAVDVTPIEAVLEIFAFAMQYAFTRLKLQHAEIEKNIDPLTQIPNRAMFERDKKDLVGRGYFAFIDIDNFKKLNDTYGHKIGDQILKGVAQIIQNTIRDDVDRVYRLGGEEFVCMLKSPVCDVEKACIAAERIRQNIHHTLINAEDGNSYNVTVSVGLASVKSCNLDYHLHSADMAMYKAKANGKNRCVASVDETLFDVEFCDGKVLLSPL